jgi:hypothetical protein
MNARQHTEGELIRDHIHVVVGLESQPELWRRFEVASEPERGVGAHTTLAQHELVDASCRYADVQSKSVRAEAEWLEELLMEHLAWVHGLDLAGRHRAPPFSGRQ